MIAHRGWFRWRSGMLFVRMTILGGLFFLPFLVVVLAAEPAVSPDDANKAHVVSAYGKLPLSFIRNDGQVDKRVKFYEKGSGHATYFTKDGVYLSLVGAHRDAAAAAPAIGGSENGAEGSTPKQETPTPRSALVKLIPLDANKNPKIVAEGMQEGKVNYFIGNDPRKWKTSVPTYQAVVYQEIYPGIDMKFYGNNRQMEYDLIVKPGADLSKVKLAYEGIQRLEVVDNGDLDIVLKEGRLLQKKPVIYQEIGGEQVPVVGHFKLLERRIWTGRPEFAYGFEVASYDKTHPLIIDPTLVYSTYLGGSSDDVSVDIAVDPAGNAYVTGYTSSVDFPTTPGAYDRTYDPGCDGDCNDVFVMKLNATGSQVIFATYLGGGGTDTGHAIAVDAAGNVYVAGDTNSSNFPTTAGAHDPTYSGNRDGFVAKLDAAGSQLSYSTYLGGSGNESGNEDMAADAAGNVYVTGSTGSLDFPVTPGAYDTTYGGGGDAFVAKLDVSGSFLSYATYLGGSSADIGYRIAVDDPGNAYVTGETWSSDFPATPGAYDRTYDGGGDVFVAKLDATGSLLYATYLGESDYEYGVSIAVLRVRSSRLLSR